MTRHRIAQIGENRNPKSPENRPQTRLFLQIRLLQLRRSATPFNGLAVLHGRLRGPSGAAIWSSPTYDSLTRRVYVTTGDNYSDPPTDTSDAILAFDAESGELVWSRQTTTGDAYNLACVRSERANCPQADGPDYDFGSSAVLTDLPGGKRALIGAQKSGMVTAVDPDHSGEIIWQKKVGRGGKL